MNNKLPEIGTIINIDGDDAVVTSHGFEDECGDWHEESDAPYGGWEVITPKYKIGDTIVHRTDSMTFKSVVTSYGVRYGQATYVYGSRGYDYIENTDASTAHTLLAVPRFAVNDIIKWNTGMHLYQVTSATEFRYHVLSLNGGGTFTEDVANTDQGAYLVAAGISS